MQIRNEVAESQAGFVVTFSLLWLRIQNMASFYDSFQITFYSLGFSHVTELEISKTELMVFYNLKTDVPPQHLHIEVEGSSRTENC